MPVTPDSNLLRVLSSGLKLHIRTIERRNRWRRIPGLTDLNYFSAVIGSRIEKEIVGQVAIVITKTGRRPDRVVIEYVLYYTATSPKLKQSTQRLFS